MLEWTIASFIARVAMTAAGRPPPTALDMLGVTTAPRGQPLATCANRHALYTAEPFQCPAEHTHWQFVCPMRLGAGWCGDRFVRPPITDQCRRDPDHIDTLSKRSSP